MCVQRVCYSWKQRHVRGQALQKLVSLQVYQEPFALFMLTGYRQYICQSCIDEFYPATQVEFYAEHGAYMELRTKCDELESKVQSKSNKVEALREETPETLKLTETKFMLKEAELSKTMSTNERQAKDITQRKQVSEMKLKADMKEQEDMFLERQEKFDLAGNPDYEVILKHENTMFKKLEQIGNGIKQTLLQ